jgi:hypothetical protein
VTDVKRGALVLLVGLFLCAPAHAGWRSHDATAPDGVAWNLILDQLQPLGHLVEGGECMTDGTGYTRCYARFISRHGRECRRGFRYEPPAGWRAGSDATGGRFYVTGQKCGPPVWTR